MLPKTVHRRLLPGEVVRCFFLAQLRFGWLIRQCPHCPVWMQHATRSTVAEIFNLRLLLVVTYDTFRFVVSLVFTILVLHWLVN